MKNPLLFLPLLITAAIPYAAAATIPAIGVQQAHGVSNDHYYVHLSDYNRIDFDDANDQYTLVAAKEKDKNGNPLSNITLSTKQYPILHVENIPDDVVTSAQEVNGPVQPSVEYSPASEALTFSANEKLNVAVYNASGVMVSSAILMPGESLPVASLGKGIHIVRAEGKNTAISIKFIR